jgi:hypothetical protein
MRLCSRVSRKLAAAEKINPSHVSRVLPLMILAPEIVEAILDGRQPAENHADSADAAVCGGWREQVEMLSQSS